MSYIIRIKGKNQTVRGEKQRMKTALQICFAILCAVLLPVMRCQHPGDFFWGAGMAVFVFALLVYTDKRRYEKRMRVMTCWLGFLFSAMTGLGFHIERQGSAAYTNLWFVAAVLVYTIVFSRLLCFGWSGLIFLEKHCSAESKPGEKNRKWGILLEKLLECPLWIFLLLLTCWLPCYLSTFPGNFYHDAADEFQQMTTGYRGDFPMLHSLIINYLLKFGHLLTGSYNTGIAVYTIIQMLLIALLFVYIIRQLYKMGANCILLGLSLVYMALFPLIHVLVTSTVRDVMFSGLLVYLVFQMYLMGNNPEAFWGSVYKPLLLGLTAALTLLARNNSAGIALIGILAVVSVWFVVGFGKKNRRGTSVFGISLTGGYLLIHMLLMSVCQPYQPADLAGSLSIMTQPIARAYFYENENWTQDQKERFEEYFAVDEMEYIPENADSTKGNCLVDKNTMLPFVKFWLSMGLRYPQHYLDAVLANTVQMWFPGSVVDGYVKSGDWPAYEKSFYFFLSEIEAPGVHMHLLPAVQQYYEALGSRITYEKIPILSLLFSIGFHFWFLLNAVFYSIYRKCGHLYIPLGILLVYTLISTLVPLVCLRYFAALFLAFPIILIFTFQPNMKTRGKD